MSAWLLGVGAVGVGSIGTYVIGLLGDRRRVRLEDQRRWLTERQNLYSDYLKMVEALAQSADSIACFLPRDEESPKMSENEDALVREMSFEWMIRWDDELQPLLRRV